MRRVVIETPCSLGFYHFKPCEHEEYEGGDGTICPGGSRRALEPGEFVLVEKRNGGWPYNLNDGVHRVLDVLAGSNPREGQTHER